MGTNKAKITFTCSHELKEGLQKWADEENRTLSNLMETLAENAIAQRAAAETSIPKKGKTPSTKHKENK